VKLTALLIIILLSGCDSFYSTFTGCEKRKVEDVTCIVCGGSHGVAASCDWGNK
jgi:hypothetical protein